jgi:porphobilinogen deaminase
MPTYGDRAGAPGITARDHQKKNVCYKLQKYSAYESFEIERKVMEQLTCSKDCRSRFAGHQR